MGKKNRREVVSEVEVEQEEFDKELAAVLAIRQEQEEKEAAAGNAQENRLTTYNRAGLEQKLAELTRDLPWIETLDTCEFPLALEKGEVHDDLKREVAFYQTTMQAVTQSIDRFAQLNIPFHRPADMFAEMMKSDEHMAKIKDKLLFENKKMEAFEQRKQRDEQRKFSKQLQSVKQKERSQAKKEQIDALTKWRKDASKHEGKFEDKQEQLENIIGDNKKRRRSSSSAAPGGAPNKKRLAKDQKYGHGGPKRLKKANDAKSTNSLKEFHPKGGALVRTRIKKGKPNRPGKAARTQKRAGKKAQA